MTHPDRPSGQAQERERPVRAQGRPAASGQRPSLPQAQARVLGCVAEHADKPEEEFFRLAEWSLCQLCEAVAVEIDAESASVFFVTEGPAFGGRPFIVMRGAAGRLAEIFHQHAGAWREAHTGSDARHAAFDHLRGFAYPSVVNKEFLAQDVAYQARALTTWPVTTQIWATGRGRIANSNRAMDELHGKVAGRSGRGDTLSYPADCLGTTFRSMIGVPIFAQVDCPVPLDLEGEDPGRGRPVSASPRKEFLSQYRVIGMVKAEGKKPVAQRVDSAEAARRLADELDRRPDLGLSPLDRSGLVLWFRMACCHPADEVLRRPFPPLLRDNGNDDPDRHRKLHLRKLVADVFGECFQAHFTRRDVELLVLMAMQVGRLPVRRITKFAALNDILITENEAGLLRVTWADVPPLAALRRAAGAAMAKLTHHLNALKAELDFNRQQDVYRARISGLLDPRGSIREVSGRLKEWPSLLRKAARKHRLLHQAPGVHEVTFSGLKGEVIGYGAAGERAILRGQARLFMHPPVRGSTQFDLRLTFQGHPPVQAHLAGDRLPVALRPVREPAREPAPLVRRLLARDHYGIDDLAGARVLTDYDSDIDEVLDEVRARVGVWGLRLGQVDDAREGKDGGYRAVHVTLHIDVSALVRPEDVGLLRGVLQQPEGPLWVPVEVQLRTAYQHSWAQKTHAVSYKREDQIPEDLHDEQEILSNVLAEADWLSDIVRSGIEGMILPSDCGERRLLAFLKRRIPRDDLNAIQFGIACARQLLADRVRYNGEPEYRFTMEVCEQLVYNFGRTDSTFLLLALLRHVWDVEEGQRPGGGAVAEPAGPHPPEPLLSEELCKCLQRRCEPILVRFQHRLPLPECERHDRDTRYQEWFRQFPTWFWAMQRGFRDTAHRTAVSHDELRPRRDRLRSVYEELDRHSAEGLGAENLDDWLERAYVMEAAILVANLTELPFEPGKARRSKLHEGYLALFREIRHYLPNGPAKTQIVTELDRVFREKEMQLDLPRKPEWWEE